MRRLLFCLAFLLGGVALADNGPVLYSPTNITAGTTSCFPTRTPANQVVIDPTGATFKCDAGTSKFRYSEIAACPSNPPSAVACTADTLVRVCKRTDAAEVWGCAGGAGFMVNMSGSGAAPSGATNDVQVKNGGALSNAPGFTADIATGAVTAKILQTTIEVSKYATAGAGTTGSPFTSPSGTGGLTEAAAACGATLGCRLHLGAYTYKVTAKATFGKGVRLEGEGPLSTVIVADPTFSGTSILEWKNPTSDNSFAGTVEQGIGARGFSINAAGVAAHGIHVFKAYDYVSFQDIAVIDAGDAVNAFRFEPNSAYTASLVSQTVNLVNLYGIHKNTTATAPVFYFAHVQEMTITNLKAFGGYSTGIGNCDVVYFLNCRGVTMIGGGVANSQLTGIRVASDVNGRSVGLAFIGVTLEAVATAVKVDGTTNSVQDLTFLGMRKETGAVTPPTATGGFTFARAVRVFADIPNFTATVDANSSDVRLGLNDLADLTSDAGARTKVVAQLAAAKTWFGTTTTQPIGIFPSDVSAPGGAENRYGHSARADYWRWFWSANSGAQFGMQLRYVNSSGVSSRAAIFAEGGDVTFYNLDSQALALSATRVTPTIFSVPKGTTPPATCSSGDLFYDTDATAGQRLLVCNTANTFVVQGDGGGNFLVNGVGVTNPNLINGSKITFGVAGSNIQPSIVLDSLNNADINSNAAIDISKLGSTTSSAWAGHFNDETGTSGAPVRIVFDQSPTINTPALVGFTPNRCMHTDGTGQIVVSTNDCSTGGGVTSVGLTLPVDFNVTNSPVTATGNLTGAWANKAANTFLAGPTSGAAAPPTFRVFNAADCLTAQFPGTAGASGCVPAPSASDISNGYFLKANGLWTQAAGLATTGTPLVTQIARFGTGTPSTSINGLATATLDDNGNIAVTSVTTSTPANGSRRAKLVGNTTDPSAPANTDALLYGKSAGLTDGLQQPFWENNNAVSAILTTRSGDMGCIVCSAGACTSDVNCIDGTMITLTGEAAGNVMYFDVGTGTWKPLTNGASGTVLQSNGVGSNPSWGTASGTATRSMYFDAGALSADGTGCTNPQEVTLNSTGPKTWVQNCPTDSGTSIFYGKTVMPDGWDAANTITFELNAENENATPSGTYIVTFSAMCRTPGTDTVGTTWGTGVAATITFTTQYRTESATTAAITPNGSACAAGDVLFWRGISNTGTTTQESNVYVLGVKMEYVTTGSD